MGWTAVASLALARPAAAVTGAAFPALASPVAAPGVSSVGFTLQPAAWTPEASAPIAPIAWTPRASGLPAASPDPTSDLYVDWISPLQAPRGTESIEPFEPEAAGVAPRAAAAATDAADGAGDRAPAAVPEPHTLALLAAGLLPLIGFSRFRFRR